MFLVNITDLLGNKFEFMNQLQIPTTVVDTWYYWEFEEYIKLLNNKNKEEKENREKQEKDSSDQYSNFSKFNPSKFMGKNFGNMPNNSAFPRI